MLEAKALEIITPSKIGGAEVYVNELCLKLPHLGLECVLFCPSGRPFVEYAKISGLNPITWKTYGKIDPLSVIKIVKLIKSTGCSVVHTHLSTASLVGSFAAKISKVRVVAHMHSMNTVTSYKFADTIIAVSEAVKMHLAEQGLEKNTVVVYNGVDIQRFAPTEIRVSRARYKLDENGTIFGVFGRLSPEKGHIFAMQAFASAFGNNKQAFLLFVGDGKAKILLKEKAVELGIADRVIFTGFVLDFETLMSACDVVVVPSLREGFGLSAVNAMSMEKPVIATTVGGLPEVVTDRGTGLLVEAGNVGSLADAMVELTSNASLAYKLGSAGRARVIDRFEVNKQVSAVKDILLNVGTKEDYEH